MGLLAVACNMKQRSAIVLILLMTCAAQGQGTFIYDQQSSDENLISGSVSILANPSQSFTPASSSIEFIRLALQDGNWGNALGATLYVNLRGGSVTGAVLAVSSSVSMPDSFFGVTNFYFSPGVMLIPKNVYYFQPVIQSGDAWIAAAYHYGYAGGMEFLGSTPFPNGDLWFREGIVPEPSSLGFFLLGTATFLAQRHRRQG